MFKHLLVPVDLDAPDVADKAIEVARHLARRDGAAITLVSVHQVVVDPGVYQGVADDPRMLDYLGSKPGDVAMKGIVVTGDSVSRAIRGAAVEHGADLIVMASHEPNMSDYLIGSNAAHVALHAECSVLVVR